MKLLANRDVSVLALLAVLAGLPLSAHADVTPSGVMMRYPAISKDKIAFVYANDIWLVPREGGVALPLSTPAGTEVFPKFSPDGSQIAFSANYDGVQSLYTLPVSGGASNRVTYFGSMPMPVGWTNQNELVFYAGNIEGMGRQSKLYHVSPNGGMPTLYPMPYGTFASVSPDGSQIAYIPHTTDFRTWKRYRGGMATDIWLFNLKDNSAKQITDWEGTDTFPMFNPAGKGDVVYYTSDQGPEHRLNVWSYDVASGKRTQLTNFTEDDVRFPSIGPGPSGKGEIIFQLGAGLTVLDLATSKTREVSVTIPGDRQTPRTRTFDAAKNLGSASISPSGKRVAVIGRGDIWTAPAKDGALRNLTRTDNINEREAAWSPDGRWLAYLSDESGEYEIWLRPSDAKPPEKKDDKKEDKKASDAKADDKKAEEKPAEAKPADAKAEEKKAEDEKKSKPRKLTSLGEGQRMNLQWSPDSKYITFSENTGKLYLLEVEPERLVVIDTDPWAGGSPTVSFSSDSQWIAYDRADDQNNNSCIWLYNTKSGQKTRVTSPMFSSSDPAFDRKGDFLYFNSNRSINNPYYSDLDTTFIYADTQSLHMIPLRQDVKSPYLPTGDEETYKEEAKKEEPKKEEGKKDEGKKEEGKKEDGKKDEAKKDEAKKDAAADADDGVTGTWSGTAKGPDGSPVPAAGIPISITLKLAADGSVTGSLTGPMGNVAITGGRYDKASGEMTLNIATDSGAGTLKGKVSGGKFEGTWSMGELGGDFAVNRAAAAGGNGAKDAKADAKNGDKSAEKTKEVKIDLADLESRAIRLPLNPGRFGSLGVSSDDKLIFVRSTFTTAGQIPGDIKIFDPKDEKKEEKLVTASASSYELTPDGKRMLVRRGSSLNVMDAAAGGGNSTSVPTAGMNVSVRPREEWKQILRDVYRYERDYFYDAGLHGVDWKKVHDHYAKMVDEAVSREDMNYIIGEMISELNIGHAYVGPVSSENPATSNVGLLGCDFTLDKTDNGSAYKITRIYTGGPWDTDARGPLSQPGVDIKEGEYILAVNGVPIDITKDVWASFQGMAERPTILTVGKSAAPGTDTRDVLVKPIASDQGLRYRAWIEKNRAYVADKSKGRIGYIYVPNTGQDGQSDLFRQFAGQRGMDALIIDERWNGGGQIPTRFIELLNRSNINYWARRHGRDWPWPPDASFGPKVMLANGLAGSGGDAFPGYFKRMGLGKVIGRRTWGGLVGIEGFRPLMDGGGVTVPSFGYYERDSANPANGRWSIEGHGTDPDIEVIDDPSKMVNGQGDPQLEVAINELLKELETKAYVTPKRPPSPQRAGMGIPPNER
ncbi:MAG: PDZ domain-containing protein [Phycisphaerales bacterium]|nr:PDZ domain-containing protein [Planctomycetota bacterium]